MIEYIVVWAFDSLSELSEIVQEKLSEGYQLQGGVSVTERPAQVYCDEFPDWEQTYYQAMIREVKRART